MEYVIKMYVKLLNKQVKKNTCISNMLERHAEHLDSANSLVLWVPRRVQRAAS